MFLLSWGTGGWNEKALNNKSTGSATAIQRPLPSQVLHSNNMKRKREDDDTLPSEARFVRGKTEHITGLVDKQKLQGEETLQHQVLELEDRIDKEKIHNDGLAQHRMEDVGYQPPESMKPNFDDRSTDQGPLAVSIKPSDVSSDSPESSKVALSSLRHTIEAQFSLEILLKHKELRLIDQELAKCQIALEQLRRCHTIPYPAMSSKLNDMHHVSTGTGSTPGNEARYAPPWGVTNGPYTRHYRQWLIPDESFGDAIADTVQAQQPVFDLTSERTMRGSISGKGHTANKSRSQRGSANARLQALPPGYAEPKEDKGPMIVKRSKDGVMVKLVCLDCRRSDFNSAQGFINHCRIAHGRNFQSHDAAANACGEEVELDQAGGVVGEPVGPSSISAGLVHPLIRSDHMIKSASQSPLGSTPKRAKPNPTGSTSSGISLPNVSTPISKDALTHGAESINTAGVPLPIFKPSPQTPHLSALFARIGREGDLEEEVIQAKTKADLNLKSESEDEGQDEEVNDATEPLSGPASLSTRGVVRQDRLSIRGGISPDLADRSSSMKRASPGPRKPNILSSSNSRSLYSSFHDSPLLNRQAHHQINQNDDAIIREVPNSPNLSPNTVESHQAPSLVSDDGDYENTHSECSSNPEDDDQDEQLRQSYLDLGFEEHDDQEMEELGGRGSGAGDHVSLSASPKGGHSTRRSSTLQSPGTISVPPLNHEPLGTSNPSRRRPRKRSGK
ncbi:MAG: hypothetical protein Q9190_004297 [Brigantiaea leucoxantha]